MTISQTNSSHRWAHEAIHKLEADSMRSADTHLHRLPLPKRWGIQLYLKDESTHLTGSLKHRLARSLFLYGLVNGWIREGMTMIEASSGSTAVSEAYFAQLLGLKFISVVPATTSPEKVELIKMRGGECHFVTHGSQMYSAAETLAAETGGYYLDQFTNAARATDWRGNNNIAETIFQQLSLEPNPVPHWIVVGSGTGGTSATIGRYARYKCYNTRLAVVDPENSAFLPGWETHNPDFTTGLASRIEGIGRPRMEPSFIPEVVDEMIRVPDGASIAAMRHLTALTGLRSGPSTGTNLWGVWQLIARMVEAGERGSVVSLLCDSADRYACTYYNEAWLSENGLDPAPYTGIIEEFFKTGRWL